MNKIKFGSLALLISNMAFCQIGTTKVAPKKEQYESLKYDSTQNFLGKNVDQYLGQELYLKGRAEILRKYGYDDFELDYKNDGFGKDNVYKCCDGFNSKYSELEGKYFKVIEILKHPKAATSDFLYGTVWFLKLEEKSSKDIVYFKYDSKFEHTFPFIVVGFFEKQKKLFVNKQFVFQDRFLEGSTDVETGTVVPINSGQVWKVIDITVDEKYYNLSLLIQNNAGQKITVTLQDILRKPKNHSIYKREDFEKYSKRFGDEKMGKILKGKVVIGMTKEMCKLSWGDPKSINETITAGKTSEQWVYSENYLYFSNGILTTIQ